LQHLRGSAIRELRSHGIEVNVLGEDFESKVLEVSMSSYSSI
jgi:diaminohydroxyphosphoribosylaminopyrimidine deaminase/5-amino-6-(5-phosphoribosylamino)uracil reductase